MMTSLSAAADKIRGTNQVLPIGAWLPISCDLSQDLFVVAAYFFIYNSNWITVHLNSIHRKSRTVIRMLHNMQILLN